MNKLMGAMIMLVGAIMLIIGVHGLYVTFKLLEQVHR